MSGVVDLSQVSIAAIGSLLADLCSRLASKIFDRAGRDDNFALMAGQSAARYPGQDHHPQPCVIGAGVMELGPKTIRPGQALFRHRQRRVCAGTVLIGTRGGESAELRGPVHRRPA